MKYIIMCGGKYPKWDTPRQLTLIKGEPVVCRTIRLLREAGVEDIAISTDNDAFNVCGVPLLKHRNDFVGYCCDPGNYWVDGFYPSTDPVCYLMGDVVFSPEAIRTIANTRTDSIEFFASAPPFGVGYTKPWAEPFGFKVHDTQLFFWAVRKVRSMHDMGMFCRGPIAWELWQVIKGTPINHINFENYVAINDYTCDIDDPADVKRIERYVEG